MQDWLKLVPLFAFVSLFNSVVALILWSSSQLFILANVIAVYLLRDVCTGYMHTVWHVYHRHTDGRSDPIFSWQPLSRIRLIGSFTSTENMQSGVTILAIPVCFFYYSQALQPIKDSLRATKTIIRYRYALTPIPGTSPQFPRLRISSKV